MNTSGNVVLITGGGRGIGLALAKRFMNEKNKVLICDKDEQLLQKVKDQFPELIPVHCDISDIDSINRMIKFIKENQFKLNILVNNAGIQNIGLLEKNEFSIEKIIDELNVNLRGPIVLTKLLLPILKDKDSAAIINVSSLLAKIYKESAPVYCATKSGLHAFSRSLRYQLQNTSVKVFEVMPPIVATPMTEGRGNNKMSPDDLASEFFDSFSKDIYQVEVGKTKLLFLLHRFFPNLVDKYIRNG